MGRVIRREVIAYRCELRTCDSYMSVYPLPIDAPKQEQEGQLLMLLDRGWGLVLSPRLRTYCSDHAEYVWACSCRTNPDRRHLCTVHSREAASLVIMGYEASCEKLSA